MIALHAAVLVLGISMSSGVLWYGVAGDCSQLSGIYDREDLSIAARDAMKGMGRKRQRIPAKSIKSFAGDGIIARCSGRRVTVTAYVAGRIVERNSYGSIETAMDDGMTLASRALKKWLR